MKAPIDIVALCRDIHAGNRDAGWWTNLTTGECIIATRNRPEILMLVVSELSEASEGFAQLLPDDKLPHLPMWHVELADVAIRLTDVLGADLLPSRLAAGAQLFFDTRVREYAAPIKGSLYEFDARLMDIVNALSRAMEAHRKSRPPEYQASLLTAAALVFALAEALGFDLVDVIAQKRAYNANRADHKIDARKADDGKKY